MEIPILARPGDRRSTDVLVGLLQHKNKHVRESACQSLGRLGGSQARVALEQLRDSGDPQVEALATDSLEFCNMIQMAYDMQSREAEDASALGSVLDYSPDVIYVCASIAVLAFALALVAWFRYAIPLVHPVLATMGLIFSVSLTIAAIWKHTSSESRNG
ncbi:MAG: HEAT repeat domain-containing protein [Thermoguttaceae bacterium]|jgi:hypothetical protein